MSQGYPDDFKGKKSPAKKVYYEFLALRVHKLFETTVVNVFFFLKKGYLFKLIN